MQLMGGRWVDYGHGAEPRIPFVRPQPGQKHRTPPQRGSVEARIANRSVQLAPAYCGYTEQGQTHQRHAGWLGHRPGADPGIRHHIAGLA